ncbi:MAG: recombinase [Candidatus Peregrinibacteria bacterium GW2011_GWE2_39_6]|nr:MAG: recombinase [Candidatus Peregrinibacteria bacterium GW2011_GWF2_39_17]KKR25594.1 MAG: recombinase [Candidatus Peregrinibacteria bacterium GW2011_GWE2_39_6]
MKYFIYARKSTDENDRQVLSIEGQVTELREFAVKEKLEVIDEFIESKTAKVPGRPIFNKMIKKIGLNGHADNVGILAWHPDRLARNSIDGLERMTGIEPVPQPWEGRVLPLYYIRNLFFVLWSANICRFF